MLSNKLLNDLLITFCTTQLAHFIRVPSSYFTLNKAMLLCISKILKCALSGFLAVILLRLLTNTTLTTILPSLSHFPRISSVSKYFSIYGNMIYSYPSLFSYTKCVRLSLLDFAFSPNNIFCISAILYTEILLPLLYSCIIFQFVDMS